MINLYYSTSVDRIPKLRPDNTVWNLNTEQWIPLRQWMRWCPYIWTNSLKYAQEDWDKVSK